MQHTPDKGRRAWWLKQLHEWHWVSAALCLVGMLAFSITGITLNHAGQIEAKPAVLAQQATVPAPLLDELKQQAEAGLPGKTAAALPAAVQAWVRQQWSLDTAGLAAEWSPEEVYLSLPRPGGDGWLRLSLDNGEAEYELTDRGWISYFNDLHKGRHTGTAWSWFIDIFAVATLVFSLTGLFILKMHAAKRALTWPVVGLGLVAPLLLAILFIH
jgi:hypothetical protein